jgi:hypothetical protein
MFLYSTKIFEKYFVDSICNSWNHLYETSLTCHTLHRDIRSDFSYTTSQPRRDSWPKIWGTMLSINQTKRRRQCKTSESLWKSEGLHRYTVLSNGPLVLHHIPSDQCYVSSTNLPLWLVKVAFISREMRNSNSYESKMSWPQLLHGTEVIFHSFLTSALDGGEWSASRPCRFIPEKI